MRAKRSLSATCVPNRRNHRATRSMQTQEPRERKPSQDHMHT
jgi:hypothetical protein